MSLADDIEYLRHLPKRNGFDGLGAYGRSYAPAADSLLAQTTGFGSNPGGLKMYSYVPRDLPRGAGLVVVLHGCGQIATGYDRGTGWSALAKRYGFALLMPGQRLSNNANTCFNWFNPEDTARDHGEVHSIRQMIAHMTAEHEIDPRRIFVTGLSAGGAMTCALLATYPDVFAAGAIVAGLPFGIATNLREALGAMRQASPLPARELGDRVRNATEYRGPWPKVSVWHGSADGVVSRGNADEIVKQWLDVHGLPPAPMTTAEVAGYPREVWWNAEGETIVESYTITDMTHGTPLGIADDDERYGEAGPFLVHAGISSTYRIAEFFGLTGGVRAATVRAAAGVPVKELLKPALNGVSRDKVQPVPPPAPVPMAELTMPRANPAGGKRPRNLRRHAIQIGDAINRALSAAGLKTRKE